MNVKFTKTESLSGEHCLKDFKGMITVTYNVFLTGTLPFHITRISFVTSFTTTDHKYVHSSQMVRSQTAKIGR